MKISITYPHIEKHIKRHKKVLNVIKLLMLLAAIICPSVNVAVGGESLEYNCFNVFIYGIYNDIIN